MARLREPHVISTPGGEATGVGSVRTTQLHIARAANDNQRVHAPWRRFVAASMAVLFAASLILVGLVCIANAATLVIGT